MGERGWVVLTKVEQAVGCLVSTDEDSIRKASEPVMSQLSKFHSALLSSDANCAEGTDDLRRDNRR